MDPTDAQLLSASARNPEAFGRFYDRYAIALLGWFVRRTADAQAAADLTSETFAAAFASRRSYRDVGAPAFAWLLGIARHELADSLRHERVDDRARRRLGLERTELDDESIERIEQLTDSRAFRAAVAAALGELAPDTARAVALRVTEELPDREVAERLGCSEGAARVRVARGLRHLSDLLEHP